MIESLKEQAENAVAAAVEAYESAEDMRPGMIEALELLYTYF